MKADHILKGVLMALLVTATFNLAWQIHREAQAANDRQRLYEEHGFIACKFGPSQDESSRFLIGLGLGLAFVGCRVGRRLGKLASLVGLLFAAGVYALWWRYYFTLMEVSEAGDGAVPHLLFLYGGQWLDLCIASALPVVIAWQSRSLVLSLVSDFVQSNCVDSPARVE